MGETDILNNMASAIQMGSDKDINYDRKHENMLEIEMSTMGKTNNSVNSSNDNNADFIKFLQKQIKSMNDQILILSNTEQNNSSATTNIITETNGALEEEIFSYQQST